MLKQPCGAFVIVMYLAAPCGMQDLCPRLGIEPMPPAVEAQSLNHWIAGEVPQPCVLKIPNSVLRKSLGSSSADVVSSLRILALVPNCISVKENEGATLALAICLEKFCFQIGECLSH